MAQRCRSKESMLNEGARKNKVQILLGDSRVVMELDKSLPVEIRNAFAHKMVNALNRDIYDSEHRERIFETSYDELLNHTIVYRDAKTYGKHLPLPRPGMITCVDEGQKPEMPWTRRYV